MKSIRTIHCACGAGIATSIIMELNIQKSLERLGRNDVQVTHSAVDSVNLDTADIFVVSKDLADRFDHYPRVIVIDQIMSHEEIYDKVKEALSREESHFWIED